MEATWQSRRAEKLARQQFQQHNVEKKKSTASVNVHEADDEDPDAWPSANAEASSRLS